MDIPEVTPKLIGQGMYLSAGVSARVGRSLMHGTWVFWTVGLRMLFTDSFAGELSSWVG